MSWQFSERPCLKSLRQKVIEEDTIIYLWHLHAHTWAHTTIHSYASPPPLSLISVEQIMGERGLDVNYKLLAQMPTLTNLPPVSVHFLGSWSECTSASPDSQQACWEAMISYCLYAPCSPEPSQMGDPSRQAGDPQTQPRTCSQLNTIHAILLQDSSLSCMTPRQRL